MIYPVTALVLFIHFCYLLCVPFQFIQNEIGHYRRELINGQDENLVRCLLIMYKQNHVLACETVESINDCFGGLLTLASGSFVIATTNSVFYTFGMDNYLTLADVVFVIFPLVHLTLMCHSADRISVKVLYYRCFIFLYCYATCNCLLFYRPRRRGMNYSDCTVTSCL